MDADMDGMMIDSVNSPYIHAANAANFRALMLDYSQRGPVLVNFWSRKAGLCLRQYPLLDKTIHDYAGRVFLINIDRRPCQEFSGCWVRGMY